VLKKHLLEMKSAFNTLLENWLLSLIFSPYLGTEIRERGGRL
jgi:hypothetical protein